MRNAILRRTMFRFRSYVLACSTCAQKSKLKWGSARRRSGHLARKAGLQRPRSAPRRPSRCSTVCALEPRSAAQYRHHVMSPHHPISCADAVVLRDDTHHLCSSPAHRWRPSRGAEPPAALDYARERGCEPRGRRRSRVVCAHVRAPRSRCWAFLGLWRLMAAAEGWIYQPSMLPLPRPLI